MRVALALFCLFIFSPFLANDVAIPHRQSYSSVAFYVCAHQDDWQLFMGEDVYNDITDVQEIDSIPTRSKVVIIYTTAGNLNDSDDTKTCDCGDVHRKETEKIPYWKVREMGAKNSVHLAANILGEYGPAKYPKEEKISVNGHQLVRYVFKNTVSYFLRIKAGKYGCWYSSPECYIGTVDNSSSYSNREDMQQTLAAIYRHEMANTTNAAFHLPDSDEHINPNDHNDHIIAGRAGVEAVKILAHQNHTNYPVSLYIDYHSENLPANINGKAAQNEAALTATYCMALLDYNAWPEWGGAYQSWTCRNYCRTLKVNGD